MGPENDKTHTQNKFRIEQGDNLKIQHTYKNSKRITWLAYTYNIKNFLKTSRKYN